MSDTTKVTSPVEADVTSRRFDVRRVLTVLGPAIGLVAVCILFGALRPDSFLTRANAQNIILHSVVVGIAAIGTTPVIISAGIDISIGATIAVVTVAVALLVNANVPPLLAAFGGVGVGAACGLFNGACITWLGLNPFIVTLGTFLAFRGVADELSHQQAVAANATWLNNLMAPGQAPLVPWGVWILLALLVLTALMLRYTRFGRHIFAIGSNEQTARLCGIAVNRAKLAIYVLGGAFTGIAGVLMFSNLTEGDPTTSANTPLTAIAAAVIGGASLTGGQGSIVGTVLGAVFIMTIRSGCTQLNFSQGVQEMVTGLIIILAVLLDRVRNLPKA
ncbi:MAG: ABC transporter permease [Phycisphaerae bacterium]